MLYIIAGVSLSGKTTTRKFIAHKYGLCGIDTDTLRTMANSLHPDLHVGHDKTPIENYTNMREVIQAFIKARSFFSEDYILEGDCINIYDLSRDCKAVRSVTVGCPNCSLNDLLNLVSSCPSDHWSRGIEKRILIDKLESFLEFSRFIKEESLSNNIPFVDVSDCIGRFEATELIVNNLFRSSY